MAQEKKKSKFQIFTNGLIKEGYHTFDSVTRKMVD